MLYEVLQPSLQVITRRTILSCKYDLRTNLQRGEFNRYHPCKSLLMTISFPDSTCAVGRGAAPSGKRTDATPKPNETRPRIPTFPARRHIRHPLAACGSVTEGLAQGTCAPAAGLLPASPTARALPCLAGNVRRAPAPVATPEAWRPAPPTAGAGLEAPKGWSRPRSRVAGGRA